MRTTAMTLITPDDIYMFCKKILHFLSAFILNLTSIIHPCAAIFSGPCTSVMPSAISLPNGKPSPLKQWVHPLVITHNNFYNCLWPSLLKKVCHFIHPTISQRTEVPDAKRAGLAWAKFMENIFSKGTRYKNEHLIVIVLLLVRKALSIRKEIF